MSDLSVLQVVWPGISTLLGAFAGGGVTLWANRQKSWQEERVLNEARKRSIKDRSFNACVDVLKAGRLVTAEADSLWFEVYLRASNDRIAQYDIPFQSAIRNWYATSEAFRLTTPPRAKDAFQAYGTALQGFLRGVDGYKNDYLRGVSWDQAENEALSDGCAQRRDEVLAKRNEFVEIVKTQLDEGVWPKT